MAGDGGVRAAVLRVRRVLGLLAGCVAYDAVISPSSSGHVPLSSPHCPLFCPASPPSLRAASLPLLACALVSWLLLLLGVAVAPLALPPSACVVCVCCPVFALLVFRGLNGSCDRIEGRSPDGVVFFVCSCLARCLVCAVSLLWWYCVCLLRVWLLPSLGGWRAGWCGA